MKLAQYKLFDSLGLVWLYLTTSTHAIDLQMLGFLRSNGFTPLNLDGGVTWQRGDRIGLGAYFTIEVCNLTLVTIEVYPLRKP